MSVGQLRFKAASASNPRAQFSHSDDFMKLSFYLLISAAFALTFGACNKHSWDEAKGGQPPTKDLFDHGHGDDHAGGGHDEHLEKSGHAEEKTESGEKKAEKAH